MTAGLRSLLCSVAAQPTAVDPRVDWSQTLAAGLPVQAGGLPCYACGLAPGPAVRVRWSSRSVVGVVRCKQTVLRRHWSGGREFAAWQTNRVETRQVAELAAAF